MSTRPLAVDEALYAYLIEKGTREDALLARLRDETATTGFANMQVSPDCGAFLALLVKLVGARSIVEIGTFTGYSALCMARALPDDGRLLCCDVSREWTDIARRYWAEAGVGGRIELALAPAADTLRARLDVGAAGTVDLVFLDADKESYPIYLDLAVDLLRPGGLLVVDNVLWGGSVINPDDTRTSTAAIRAFNDAASVDPRVDVALITVGDGMFLLRKRGP